MCGEEERKKRERGKVKRETGKRRRRDCESEIQRGREKEGKLVCVCVWEGGTSEVRGRDLSGRIEFAGERADIVCERKTKREREEEEFKKREREKKNGVRRFE